MRIQRFIFIVLFAVFLAGPIFAANKIAELEKKAQRLFHLPKVPSVTLSNGIKCYLMEDHSLPMVGGAVMIRGGGVYEDDKALGAGYVAVNLLEDGGTLKNKPEEMRELLDQNAIGISFDMGAEFISGSFVALSKDADKALGYLFEMMFEPAFDKDAMVTLKKRLIDAMRRDDDLPGPIANKEFVRLVYGDKNTWGRIVKISDIRGVTKNDVIEFYNRFFSPDRMILVIAGDFKKKELVKGFEALAKKYPKKELPEAVLPPLDAEDFSKTKLIRRNFAQSAINIGHLGTTRDNHDKYALVMLDYILGGSGGFTNRLKASVRVREGLVYRIFSSYSFGPKGVPGIFQVYAETRPENVDRAVNLIKSEIKAIAEEGVTKEEFKKAKAGILNQLVFNYERPIDIVSEIGSLVYYGYPEDYAETYKKELEKVTISEVNEAAKKYLHPDKLKVVVVGQRSK